MKRNVHLSVYLSSNISTTYLITQYVAPSSICPTRLPPPLRPSGRSPGCQGGFKGRPGHKTAEKNGGAQATHRWEYQLPNPNFPQYNDCHLQRHPHLPLVLVHSCHQPKGPIYTYIHEMLVMWVCILKVYSNDFTL